jgi:hypothetical protein
MAGQNPEQEPMAAVRAIVSKIFHFNVPHRHGPATKPPVNSLVQSLDLAN